MLLITQAGFLRTVGNEGVHVNLLLMNRSDQLFLFCKPQS